MIYKNIAKLAWDIIETIGTHKEIYEGRLIEWNEEETCALYTEQIVNNNKENLLKFLNEQNQSCLYQRVLNY